MADLAKSPRLNSLSLERTRITDAGLAELKNLRSLRELWLDGASVTNTGVDELKKALPGLTTHR